MSLVSRVLVDDALEHVMRFVPTGERLALRRVSRQFNAVVKRDIKRHSRRVRVSNNLVRTLKCTFESIIEALFPPEQSQQWIFDLDVDIPKNVDSGRVGACLRYVRRLIVSGQAVQHVFYQELASLEKLYHRNSSAIGAMTLASFTALRVLCLSNCAINDECLQNMSLLTSLALQSCPQVTGTCFSHFSELRVLSIISNGIDHNHLTSLRTLQWLNTRGSQGFRGGHQVTQLASTLTYLDASRCPQLSLSSLSALTSLVQLSLQSHDHERLTAAMFAPFSALVDLDISCAMNVDDDALSKLSKLTRLSAMNCGELRRLSLQQCASSLTYLAISDCPQLESASLQSLTRLNSLYMMRCQWIAQEELLGLVRCSYLEKLRFDECWQIDESLVWDTMSRILDVDPDEEEQ